MKKATPILIVINLLVVLCVVNGSVIKKNRILDQGRTVFLKLAPVDPRSLMQGDYMVLRQGLRPKGDNDKTRGRLVITLDADGVGSFARFDDDLPLEENEVFLKYRRANRGYRYGLESFFFAEGDAKIYESAKFCEIRVDDGGNPVLVDLRGEKLAVLGDDL